MYKIAITAPTPKLALLRLKFPLSVGHPKFLFFSFFFVHIILQVKNYLKDSTFCFCINHNYRMTFKERLVDWMVRSKKYFISLGWWGSIFLVLWWIIKIIICICFGVCIIVWYAVVSLCDRIINKWRWLNVLPLHTIPDNPTCPSKKWPLRILLIMSVPIPRSLHPPINIILHRINVTHMTL